MRGYEDFGLSILDGSTWTTWSALQAETIDEGCSAVGASVSKATHNQTLPPPFTQAMQSLFIKAVSSKQASVGLSSMDESALRSDALFEY
jgi:hypothetical protein